MNKLQLLVAWIRDLQMAPHDVVKLMTTAPYQYRHYTIPKRTGGLRDIYHPTPQLKAAQRWIVRNLLSQLPVHDCVHAYRAGRSIRTHAAVHIESNYLLRFDFRDFFPSLDQNLIRQYLRQKIASGELTLDTDALHLISRVVCRFNPDDRSLALSIGAPSSPALSNLLLYDLDCRLHSLAIEYGVIYSRYADDVYFSSRIPNVLNLVEIAFRSAVGEITPKLAINEAKTERRSRKTKRVVTGLILTSDRKVSLGRERKRSIRTLVYLFTSGQLNVESSLRLSGLLAFASDVEPEFISSLRAKFGSEFVDQLMTHSFAQDGAV